MNRRMLIGTGVVAAFAPVAGSAQSATPLPITDDNLYRAIVALAQQITATIAPELETFDSLEAFDAMGHLGTVRILERWFASTVPPAAYSAAHLNAASILSSTVSAADFIENGVQDGNDIMAKLGVSAIEVDAPTLQAAIDDLALAVGITPAGPLPESTVTSLPDETADPEPTSVPVAANNTLQTLSGFGDQVNSLYLYSGLITVSASNGGEGNFIVWMYGPDGSTDLLFNEIGAYRGETAVPLSSSGEYTVSVESTGAWSLEFDG